MTPIFSKGIIKPKKPLRAIILRMQRVILMGEEDCFLQKDYAGACLIRKVVGRKIESDNL
jgi:hypothetical protein